MGKYSYTLSAVACIGDAKSNYTEDRARDRRKLNVLKGRFMSERKINYEIVIK